MVPKTRCPICRSKKWRKEPHTGQIACDAGHVLQGYVNWAYDDFEHGRHVMRKRTQKSTRVKKERKSRANPILSHGDRARYHYFQCLQVLLRMQIQKLTELWKLPPEFEIVCRDTWALHLNLLSQPPPPEPYLYSQEQGGTQEPKAGEEGKTEEPQTGQGCRDDGEVENTSKSSSDVESSGTPDDEGESEVADTEMEELLRENSESESSGSEADEHGQSSQVKATTRKPRKGWRRDDTPAATISVLVHACWLMRIPVIYQDFINLIETYTLPYLDSIRLFPVSLTRHLTKHSTLALSPHFAPAPLLLHTITSRLSKLCFERYGIFTPELNASPVLWRAVRHMSGNPSLYACSKALARYLELPLMMNSVMAPPALRMFNRDPTSHKSDDVPSEVALIATVVIALKMVYGLDGREVEPREDWDPVWTMPATEEYMRSLRDMDASEIAVERHKISAASSLPNVPEEDEPGLDKYLDFCERALLRVERDSTRATGSTTNDLVAEYFPPGRSLEADRDEQPRSPPTPSNVTYHNHNINLAAQDDERPVLSAIQTSTSSSTARGASQSGRIRTGEAYKIFGAQDILGGLPDHYAIVLSRAAKWSGVTVDDLNAVMERFERRLVRRWQRSKRRARAEEENNIDTARASYNVDDNNIE